MSRESALWGLASLKGALGKVMGHMAYKTRDFWEEEVVGGLFKKMLNFFEKGKGDNGRAPTRVQLRGTVLSPASLC